MTQRTKLSSFRDGVYWVLSGSGSVVEHVLAKDGVASSNLVFRSILDNWEHGLEAVLLFLPNGLSRHVTVSERRSFTVDQIAIMCYLSS